MSTPATAAHPNGEKRQAWRPAPLALLMLGVTAVVAQVLLMRELLVIFYGNELSLGVMLACWLLWTAFGSGVLARVPAPNPRTLVAVLLTAVAFALPLTIFALRSVSTVFNQIPGEILGPVALVVTAIGVLAVFCSLTGWLFAAGSRLYSLETGGSIGAASSTAYLLDAAGSAVGGLLASTLLIPCLSATQAAALLASANSALAIALLLVRRGPPDPAGKLRHAKGANRTSLAIIVIAALGFAGTAALLVAAPWIERASLARMWPGFQVVASTRSIYGDLTVVETEGTRTLFENGVPVASGADPAVAEEAVHFALLQHPAPRSLLLIGGGFNGSLAQALQHRTLERIDYVELDPAILRLARRFFPEAWAPIDADRRVRVHQTDGRLFLKAAGEAFDVIVVNLPEPRTAQLNRFYTSEFFREAAARLAPGGVFSFRLAASENYISPELADFLRCINRTLRTAFPVVAVMPGESVHFFAAKRAEVLANDVAHMLTRLRERRLQTVYVREYYLPFRMMPERVHDLESQIAPQPHTPVNRDFAPIAYYFDVVLWSSRFAAGWKGALAAAARVPFGAVAGSIALLLLAAAALLCFADGGRRASGAAEADATLEAGSAGEAPQGPAPRCVLLVRRAVGWCVGAMGFTLMALELLLLLAFQALYGYLYYQLVVIIAGLMAGIALGTWRGMRPATARRAAGQRRDLLRLGVLQAAAAGSALLLCALFELMGRASSVTVLAGVAPMLFALLAAACGALAGYQFPIASRLFFPAASGSHDGELKFATTSGATAGRGGSLYALDLAGACLGALLLSVYFIPVFGFVETAALVALINLLPAALVFSTGHWAQGPVRNSR